MRRVTVLLALVVPVLSAVAAPVPASAEPAGAAGGPALTSVSLSTGAVSARGLATVPVTVDATATYPDSGCSGTEGAVTLARTAPAWDRSAPDVLVAPMSCVAVTGDAHTLRAVVRVPSSAHGSWRVRCVVLEPACLDPRAAGLPDATLAVTGTHRPRLRLTLAPQPLPYPQRTVTAIVQASYDDTRAPVVGRRVVIVEPNGDCAGCVGTTDAHGRSVHRLTPVGLRDAWASLPIDTPGWVDLPPLYSSLHHAVVVRPALFAAPAVGAVRHGTTTRVDGRALAVATTWDVRPRVRVALQRLVGRHWRTVGADVVRPSGRFTLLVTPPEGLTTYRVTMPALRDLAAATSRPFVLRGT